MPDASSQGATRGRGEFAFSPGKTTEQFDRLEIALRSIPKAFATLRLSLLQPGSLSKP
jgi:hypothetical protein